MTSISPDLVLQAVQSVVGRSDELTLLHEPSIPECAWEFVKECLDTGWVSSAGAFVTKFEEQLAETTGVKRAVAVVNGTAALQVCLQLAGVQPGDEVIAPSLSFVATANAIRHANAQPHFVDVCPKRLGMCPEALSTRLNEFAVRNNGVWVNRETGARIAAICPMHCFGHPCDMDRIVEVSERFEIPIVEDAAESLGSYYKGKHTGRFGTCAAVSFNGNKILTTGGGGAILTDDEQLADRAKHLTTTAKVPHRWEFHHDEVGWNFRMPNLNAALGHAQLLQLNDLLKSKRELHAQYDGAFENVEGVELMSEPAESQSNYWLQAILLDKGSTIADRDACLGSLNNAKIQSMPLWEPLHLLPMYRECSHGSLDVTEDLYARTINIPSSAHLGTH